MLPTAAPTPLDVVPLLVVHAKAEMPFLARRCHATACSEEREQAQRAIAAAFHVHVRMVHTHMLREHGSIVASFRVYLSATFCAGPRGLVCRSDALLRDSYASAAFSARLGSLLFAEGLNPGRVTLSDFSVRDMRTDSPTRSPTVYPTPNPTPRPIARVPRRPRRTLHPVPTVRPVPILHAGQQQASVTWQRHRDTHHSVASAPKIHNAKAQRRTIAGAASMTVAISIAVLWRLYGHTRRHLILVQRQAEAEIGELSPAPGPSVYGSVPVVEATPHDATEPARAESPPAV